MTGTPARWTICAALACAVAQHHRASAQETAASAGRRLCDGPAIGRVFVENRTIYSAVPDSAGSAGSARRLTDWLRSMANRAHRRTGKSFIERELLFEAGDCFDPMLLEESERILRALPFIADADIYPVEVGEREVHVVVDTHDEWTLKLDGRFEFGGRLRVTQASFREENLMGTGTLLGAYLIEEDERRDLGLEFRALQLAGTRLDSRVGGGRTRTGDFVYESVTYPFVGEVGKWAFGESYSQREDLFSYASPAGSGFTHANLPIRTRRAVAVLARRFGAPGDLSILGAALSWEDVSFDGFPDGVTVVSGFDFSNSDSADAATVEEIRPQVNGRRAWRVNLLVGKRNVGFVTREGLDALRAEQDVRVGTQALGTVATTVGGPAWEPEGGFHEIRGAVSLFAGTAGDRWIVNSELSVEAARPLSRPARDGAFRDVLAEVGAYFYWQPARVPRHTVVVGVSGVGGWNSSLPFQLTLGGRYAVRGYGREDFPVARRLVAHMEDRITLGSPFGLFDLGLTLFVDAGAGWTGGVPFGTDSGLRAAAGAGLRFGFPAGAKQVIRVDLAAPLSAGGLRERQFRIGYDVVSLLTGFPNFQARRSRISNPFAAILSH
ncbi:MAG: hypothetical protein OXU64_10480 [Gemmatimonadota bacterium]|nr:hypothetical protein [Gemmatimonadota bacterium]